MTNLILIPGLLCDRRLWKAQIDALAEIADIAVAGITTQSTITGMAADILKTAPDHFSLAGFSLGSQIALEIMRVAHKRVVRLALLSATHGGLPPAVANAVRHAVTALEQGGLEQYLDEAYPTYVAPRRAQDAELKSIFINMARAVGVQAGLRQMKALLAITKPFTGLKQISCQVLIVGGQEDHRIPPADHQLLAREIPGSDLVMIEDAGHFTPIEEPDQVTAALRRWLSK